MAANGLTCWRGRLAAKASDWLPIARAVCLIWIAGVAFWIALNSPGTDARAYWIADYANPYRYSIARTDDAYLYSPAFLQALAPLKLLPWEAFWMVWVFGMTAGIVWLSGPLIAALAVIPSELNPVFSELWYGNIVVPLTVMVVVGGRYPSAWALGILTKVTPLVAVLALPPRKMALALGSTAVVVAVSYTLTPDAWAAWIDVLRANASAPPDQGARIPGFEVRAFIGAGLALLARRWPLVLPVAILVALPLFWFTSLVLLLAWFRLIGRDRYESRGNLQGASGPRQTTPTGRANVADN